MRWLLSFIQCSNLKKQDTYKVVGVVLLVLMFIALRVKQRYNIEHNYFFFLVLGFGILLYTFDSLAELFVKYWMKLGKFLGDINARVILSVIFLMLLTPIALIRKLSTQKEQALSSSWTMIEEDLSDFSKPW